MSPKKRLGAQPLMFPCPVVLVGSFVEGKPTFTTVSWTGVVNSDPPMVSISLRPSRHVLKGIRERGVFSINIPSRTMVRKVDFCGVVSGSGVDKTSVCGFEVFTGDADAPLLGEAPVNMECRVVSSQLLGSHELILGEVIQVHISENCLTGGKPDGDKVDPLAYFAGSRKEYRALGQTLLPAYSVKDPAEDAQSGFDLKASSWDLQASRKERAKAVAQAVRKAWETLPEGPVLDFGCGTGLLGMEFLTPKRPVTFADTSRGMLDQVKEKLRDAGFPGARTQDLLSEPLEGNYALVVSLMTLHHIPDLEAQVRELVRVTASGGVLALADLDVEDGSFHGAEEVPHNGIDRMVLTRYLQQAGAVVFSSTTPWVQAKEVEGRILHFPIFLLLGRKA